MTSAARAKANIVAVGPSRPPAAAARQIRLPTAARYALDEYLESAAPRRVVLCPSGRDLDEDLAFLRAARERLLWPPPPRTIADAIDGLLSDTHGEPLARRARRRGPRSSRALLLEGEVTSARAAAALASPERLWIVENVGRVRLDARELARFAREGVRWAALDPVVLEGLLASPRLARARARFQRWIGGRVPVWVTRGP